MVVPDAVMERMRRASAEGKEQGTLAGTLVAQEMLRGALGMIQGVQVSAPFGKVPLALKVFEVLPGWEPAEEREAAAAGV